jgi:Domain of unknown function (DUF4340)
MAEHRWNAGAGDCGWIRLFHDAAEANNLMKARQLAIVLVALIVLGGIALVVRSRNTSSWREAATTTQGKVLNFPLNDATHVTIKSSAEELNLVNKNDVWTVAERFDYPADFTQVADVIRKLWELRPTQDVKVGPSQFGRLDLLEPGKQSNGSGSSSMLIDVKGKDDKRIAALLLGKKQLRESDQSAVGMAAAGRYAMPLDGSNRVFLISETFDQVQSKPERWLNRDFLKVQDPKAITVAGSTPNINWKLARDTTSTAWKLVDAKPGEEVDAAKATAVATLLANPSFADVMNAKTPPGETGLDKPSTVRIETFDGFVYDLRIGKLVGENYPVAVTVNAQIAEQRVPAQDEKAEDKAKLDKQFQDNRSHLTEKLSKEKKAENWIYLVSKSTIDQLLKDRSTLLVEKKVPAAPSAPDGPAASVPIAPGPKPSPAVSASPSARKRPK